MLMTCLDRIVFRKGVKPLNYVMSMIIDNIDYPY